ncbi:acyl-CoA dehydrogenase NM domain-like protein [Stereum hirsutum FP-91666 SS1]|uniref:acyl-CoA dehydrogenase NM domain-like protein n=1 Tax=Stereum hirsutum (strain FP-91666) TaxID=721885 RepID=UPI000440F696|nr:acyl-CoA dehydrogenase NM domain-like protein [Stereum hirsutum FP-91666 SS1]EIM91538.1 acyl-CoA dehydrogenase NM domain-like protein [Stereum hirsutum FP-91666 SS1]
MHPTVDLARSPLFQLRSDSLSWQARIALSYDRARAIAKIYELTVDDILHVSPRYWLFHTDPILVMDGSVATLLTIHFNLCIGTLAMFVSARSDLVKTIEELLRFEITGQYCLTELGHGLDVINLETTATALETGGFELHTPNERAAKYMPPTIPSGIPCTAVVFARLRVGMSDRGIKPFLVPIHDGRVMYPGITSRSLSPRGGTHPVNHALTSFNHVHLRQSSLLCDSLLPSNVKTEFFNNISRVVVGTLSMGALGVSALRIATFVAATYSQRRAVVDSARQVPRTIISFSTQYLPILVAISQTMVLNTFSHASRDWFVGTSSSIARHFVAAVYKVTAVTLASDMTLALGDRCGAQGLFEINQLSVLHSELRGAATAEGDILGISIRFAIDVLLKRVVVPPSTDPTSLLARHESLLVAELRAFLQDATGPRDRRTESALLPQCQGLLEAIGHRLAYDAAKARGIEDAVLQLYEASIVALDPAWYVEHEGISRRRQCTMLLESADHLYPRLDELLAGLQVDAYITAPIVSEERWDGTLVSARTAVEVWS